MKKLLTDRTGVTILEGVIALGLLAVVAGGAFAVLLSASRSSSQPDVREEMLLAVEKASDKLKAYLFTKDQFLMNPENYIGGTVEEQERVSPAKKLPSDLQGGLCGPDACSLDDDPLASCLNGSCEEPCKHDIKCMLPPICDRTDPQSEFFYQVSVGKVFLPLKNGEPDDTSTHMVLKQYRGEVGNDTDASVPVYKIEFTIKCNGYEL